MGRNVLIRSTCTFGGNLVFPAQENNYVSIDEFNRDVCQQENNSFTLYYHDRIHVDLRLSASRKVRQYRTLRTPTKSDQQLATRCNSQIALQASNFSDLFGCSWTWLPHNYNNDCSGCTAFHLDPTTMTYGWVNTECSKTLHLACKGLGEGEFSVSPDFQHLPNNGDVLACGGHLRFALPLSPREAFNLADGMWRHGLSHVWLPRIEGYTCTDVAPDIQCGEPDIPTNGSLIGEDSGFDALVTYQCDLGYKLIGTETSMCQSNGSWSGSVPICQRVDCGVPPRIKMGRVYGTSTDYGSMYGYTCNWGHVFEGRASIVSIVTTCQENGRWSVEVPDCIQRQCEVSEWGEWGECSESCEGGTQIRSREILSSHGNEINGNCPSLEEIRVCNTRKCDTCTTKVYRVPLEADQCRSAERVTNRYCAGTCRETGMCCKATVKSTKNILLFCENSPPRNFKLPVIEECGCIPCG
ncbi:sushi, von Willebrand factor type A, EGF and pentraxin domain-containing protein 1-like isoform X2 [Bolinopsis microptera]